MTIELLLPASLVFIMFSVGLSLLVNDFRQIVLKPKAIAFGLVCQMLVLPVIAFALVSLLRLPYSFAIGLIILAACPGGVTSNLLTYLAGGDSALSVSMTAISSLAGVITVPIVVNLGLSWQASDIASVVLPLGSMVAGVFLISTLPLLFGMLLRHFSAEWAQRIEPVSRRIATLLFVFVVAATFYQQRSSIYEFFSVVGPAVLALHVATLSFALSGAKLIGLEPRQRVTIVLECGMQNAAMGIFVAGTLLQNNAMVTPIIIYAVVMNVSAALIIYATRKSVSAVMTNRSA